MQVLVRLAQGRSRQEIASELMLGMDTVAEHVTTILGKIRADDTAAATAYAVDRGLASRPDAARSVAEASAQAAQSGVPVASTQSSSNVTTARGGIEVAQGAVGAAEKEVEAG